MERFHPGSCGSDSRAPPPELVEEALPTAASDAPALPSERELVASRSSGRVEGRLASMLASRPKPLAVVGRKEVLAT